MANTGKGVGYRKLTDRLAGTALNTLVIGASVYACKRCGALVVKNSKRVHTDWHMEERT